MDEESNVTAWRVGPCCSRIEVRTAAHAKRLRERGDTRLVAVGVAGGYLRVFEIRRPPWFVRKLVARYRVKEETRNEAAANARFCEPPSSPRCAEGADRCRTAERGRKGQES